MGRKSVPTWPPKAAEKKSSMAVGFFDGVEVGLFDGAGVGSDRSLQAMLVFLLGVQSVR